MGEEKVADQSALRTAAGEGLLFLERHGHRPGILAGTLEAFIAEVLGPALLRLGILRVEDRVAEGPELVTVIPQSNEIIIKLGPGAVILFLPVTKQRG